MDTQEPEPALRVAGSATDGPLVAECPGPVDLADGYAELSPLPTLEPDLLQFLATTPHDALEQAFLTRYGEVSGEPLDRDDVVLTPTASTAIAAIARHLVRNGVRRIGVPEPTFDNLPRLLREAGLDLVAVPLTDDAVLDAVAKLDAYYLVLPNNPTGWVPAEATLRALPEVAARSGCRVILDRTCRFHQVAQYPWLLGDYAWIDVEDTGKTWSTGGTKVAFIRARTTAVRDDIARDLDAHFHQVPALNLHLATRAIEAEEGATRIRAAVAANRARAAEALEPLGFSVISEPLGVALLRMPETAPLDSSTLVEKLRVREVDVLAGRSFYWHEPEKGDRILRIALARPTETYPTWINRLVAAVRPLM